MNPRYVYLFVLITSLYLVTYSHGFVQSDYVHLVLRSIDPQYLSGDWYLDSMSGFSARYYFIQTIKLAYAVIPDFGLLSFILTYLPTLAIGFSTFHIGLFFMKDWRKAFTLVLFLFLSSNLLYLGSLKILHIGNFLRPNLLAWAFILAGFSLIVHKQTVIGFFILGFGTLFQPVETLIAACCFYAYHLITTISLRKSSLRSNLKEVLKPSSYLVISLFNLIPLLSGESGTTDPHMISYIVANLFHPIHSVYSAIPFVYYVTTLLLVVLGILSLSSFKHPAKKGLIAMIPVALLIAFLQYVFVEISPVPFVAKAQFSRAFALVVFILSLLIVHQRYTQITKTRGIERIFLIGTLLAFISQKTFIICSILYIVYYLFRRYSNLNIMQGWTPIILALSCTFFVLKVPFSFTNISSIYRVLFVLLTTSLALGISLFWESKKRRYLLLCTLLCAVVLYQVLSPAHTRDMPQLDGHMRTVCDYVKETTLPSSKFVLIDSALPLRLCAKRAIAIGGDVFSDKALLELYEQYQDFGANITLYDKNIKLEGPTFDIGHFSAQRFLELSEKYNFEYIISGHQITVLNPIFTSGDLYLYRIHRSSSE
jgi:hypothetical protein